MHLFILVTASLSAQKKELVVTYKYDRVEMRYKDLKSLEVIKSNRPTEFPKVYSYGKLCLRQTRRSISCKDLSNVLSYDTTYYHTLVDYTKGKMWCVTPGQYSGFATYIKEPLNLFQWKFEPETKTLLGYHCTKATCTFRGRDYVAFFTRELPFKAAPWKFHALPGVVLEVYSTDNIVRWKAQSLIVRVRQSHPEIPTPIDEVLSLEQYVKKLQQKRKQNNEENLEQTIFRFPKFEDSFRLKFKNSKLPNSLELFDLDKPRENKERKK
ncbi:GLPGLI family protein [Marinifilum sp.]|uniref:GLPGLI family protein n=1 Tax=Marinifilum sp. TaxID=2033137 RepID=UPI003BAC5EE5